MPSVTLVQITVPCQICSVSNIFCVCEGGSHTNYIFLHLRARKVVICQFGYILNPGHCQAPEWQRHTSSCLPGL